MIVRREWHRNWLGIQVDYIDEETSAVVSICKFYTGLVGTAWRPAVIHDWGRNQELARLADRELQALNHCYPAGTMRPYREEHASDPSE